MRHRRLGFLVPATNTTFERETYAVLPPGVSAHFARIPFEEVRKDVLENMQVHVKRLTADLTQARVSVVAFACTTGSMIGGPGYDGELVERMQEQAACPVTTTTTAVLDALRVLGVRSVGLVTPYENWLTDHEAGFLEHAGYRVTATRCLGLKRHIADVSAERVYELALEVAAHQAEALFISCTNLRTVEVIRDLEEDLSIPVVTSNQATWWQSLQLAGVSPSQLPLGRLMSHRR